MRSSHSPRWSLNLHPRTDLALLYESLSQLSTTPYFNRALEKQVVALAALIDHVLTRSPQYDDKIVRDLVDKVWMTHRYLQGSTTKESPYEIEYCLRPAISEWLPGEHLLTTALTEERDFHLAYGDPWDYVAATVPGFTQIPTSRLIFVGVPRLYKYLPLFCSALFHELGHFVDLSYELTEATMMLWPAPKASLEDILTQHRREYFADIFAASYVGRAISESLNSISPTAKMSLSHPATDTRLQFIETFLTDDANEEIDMWRDVLARRDLPQLVPRFKLPDVGPSFDDIRPVTVSGTDELFGLFPAGWSYMSNAVHGNGPEWTRGASRLEVVRIVNDLTEKSIRNASIRKLWEQVPA